MWRRALSSFSKRLVGPDASVEQRYGAVEDAITGISNSNFHRDRYARLHGNRTCEGGGHPVHGGVESACSGGIVNVIAFIRVIVDVVHADWALGTGYQRAVGSVDEDAHDVVVGTAHVFGGVFLAGKEVTNMEGVA